MDRSVLVNVHNGQVRHGPSDVPAMVVESADFPSHRELALVLGRPPAMQDCYVTVWPPSSSHIPMEASHGNEPRLVRGFEAHVRSASIQASPWRVSITDGA
jgi:hypothetical protein